MAQATNTRIDVFRFSRQWLGLKLSARKQVLAGVHHTAGRARLNSAMRRLQWQELSFLQFLSLLFLVACEFETFSFQCFELLGQIFHYPEKQQKKVQQLLTLMKKVKGALPCYHMMIS